MNSTFCLVYQDLFFLWACTKEPASALVLLPSFWEKHKKIVSSIRPSSPATGRSVETSVYGLRRDGAAEGNTPTLAGNWSRSLSHFTECSTASGHGDDKLLKNKVEIVCIFIYLFVCPLIYRERIYRFAPNVACLFIVTRKRTQGGHNSGESVEFESRWRRFL
jgi:hypothetical protein